MGMHEPIKNQWKQPMNVNKYSYRPRSTYHTEPSFSHIFRYPFPSTLRFKTTGVQTCHNIPYCQTASFEREKIFLYIKPFFEDFLRKKQGLSEPREPSEP